MIKQLIALVLVLAIANTFFGSFTKQHTCPESKMEAGFCPEANAGGEGELCYSCSVSDLAKVAVVFNNNLSEAVGSTRVESNKLDPSFRNTFSHRSGLYLRPPPNRVNLRVLFCIYRT